MSQEITLRVSEVRYRDVGKKIARLSDYTMKKLGIETESYIEITGPKGSVPVQVKSIEHNSDDEIGIDNNIRKFIGADIGDKVKVRKANVRPAAKVVLAPVEQSVFYISSFPEYVKYELLMNKPLTKGETIPIPTIGGSLDLVVVETQPSGYVYVTDSTNIEIREEPAKEIELGESPRINWEDMRDIKSLNVNVSSPPIIKDPSSPQTPTVISSTSPSAPLSAHINSVPLSDKDILMNIRSFQSRARDVLEAVAAAVLQDLGFETKVDEYIDTNYGGKKEVDVWAQKNVLNIKFKVYVSCKNYDGNVDSSIVEQEIGRVDQLVEAPSIKFIVASQFSEQARKATISNEFIPIQIGFKVNKDNINEILEAYKRIYRIMYAIFSSMSPKRL